MKRIIMAVILLFSMTLCTSCDLSFLHYQGDDEETNDKVDKDDKNDTDTDDKNNNDKNENTNKDEEIKIIDVVVEGTENAKGYLNVDYVPEGIKIYAIDSKGVKTDVTKKAKFTADTTKLGGSLVSVAYLNFTCQYLITVLSDRVKALEASFDNLKVAYGLNERLDLTNLHLTAVYYSGNRVLVTNYTYVVKYNGEEVEEFLYEGEYVVIVTYIDEEQQEHFISFLVTADASLNPHTHQYEKQVIPPTCTEEGFTLNRCSCGDEFKEEIVPATGHSLIMGVCQNCHITLSTTSITAEIIPLSTVSVYIAISEIGSNITSFDVKLQNVDTSEFIIISSFNSLVDVEAGTNYILTGGYCSTIDGVSYYVSVSGSVAS